MRQMWTPTELCELVSRYPAEGAAGVARRLGRSTNSIISQARRYRIRSESRRLRQAHSKAVQCKTVNARFFEELTPTVAYVVGFIWSAGSVKTRHRSVLRLSVDSDRQGRLQHVLQLMKSRHQVQRHGHKLVVEVCNSRLVHSLINRFGRPGHANPQPAIPLIPATLIPEFARGYLDAVGYEAETVIRWTGYRETVKELRNQILSLVAVSDPKTTEFSRSISIAWTDAVDVLRIRSWLRQLPEENPATPEKPLGPTTHLCRDNSIGLG